MRLTPHVMRCIERALSLGADELIRAGILPDKARRRGPRRLRERVEYAAAKFAEAKAHGQPVQQALETLASELGLWRVFGTIHNFLAQQDISDSQRERIAIQVALALDNLSKSGASQEEAHATLRPLLTAALQSVAAGDIVKLLRQALTPTHKGERWELVDPMTARRYVEEGERISSRPDDDIPEARDQFIEALILPAMMALVDIERKAELQARRPHDPDSRRPRGRPPNVRVGG